MRYYASITRQGSSIRTYGMRCLSVCYSQPKERWSYSTSKTYYKAHSNNALRYGFGHCVCRWQKREKLLIDKDFLVFLFLSLLLPLSCLSLIVCAYFSVAILFYSQKLSCSTFLQRYHFNYRDYTTL